MFHIRLKLLRELMNLTQTEMATMLDKTFSIGFLDT